MTATPTGLWQFLFGNYGLESLRSIVDDPALPLQQRSRALAERHNPVGVEICMQTVSPG